MDLSEQLAGVIPGDLIRDFSGRFDVVGDIAIVKLSSGLQKYDQIIAAAIVNHRHGIRTVAKKIAKVTGDFRTARYAVIRGKSTVTTHREYGFSYCLDLNTSFFNPRLAQERRRVTGQVRPGEKVFVPFCGVGPFVIPAAARGASVVAMERNPDACRFLNENIRKNRVGDRVTVLAGDAFNPGLLPLAEFDRAIIPTPYGRDHSLKVIVSRVRHEGIVHFYTFKNREQSNMLEKEFEKTGYRVLSRHRCGNVAPAVSRWVFDLLIP